MSKPKTKKAPSKSSGEVIRKGSANKAPKTSAAPAKRDLHRPFPARVLRAILAGAPKLPDLHGYDTLDLSKNAEPDLRFADPEELEPLLRSEAMRGIERLIMAEGAKTSLAAVLAALPAGALRSIHLRTTEAYTSASDASTLAHIAASPAATRLQELRLERTFISNLQALTGSPLRELQALHLTGRIDAEEHLALGAPAPALRSLRRLTLTPDDLTEEAALRMAASADLVGLEELELPFMESVGSDWGGGYAESAFCGRFPPALAAIQALPSLRVLRFRSPLGKIQPPELGDVVQRGILAALTSRQKVSIDKKLFDEELLEAVRTGGGSGFEWPVMYSLHDGLPPFAAWLEQLHQRGARAALGWRGRAPSVADRPVLDSLAEQLRSAGITNNQVVGETADLIRRWGQPTLLSMLESRGAEGIEVYWSHDPDDGRELYSVLYDARRFTEQDAIAMFDVDELCFEQAPEAEPDQERIARLAALVGIARTCQLYETMGLGRVSIVDVGGEVGGEYVMFDPDRYTLEQVQAAEKKR